MGVTIASDFDGFDEAERRTYQPILEGVYTGDATERHRAWAHWGHHVGSKVFDPAWETTSESLTQSSESDSDSLDAFEPVWVPERRLVSEDPDSEFNLTALFIAEDVDIDIDLYTYDADASPGTRTNVTTLNGSTATGSTVEFFISSLVQQSDTREPNITLTPVKLEISARSVDGNASFIKELHLFEGVADASSFPYT